MREELLEMKGRLERLRREGVLDDDVDGAYWAVERVLEGRGWGTVGGALDYAREVVGRYEVEVRERVRIEVREVTKEEHDGMMGEERVEVRGVDREEYERMMREAREA